MGKRHPLLAAGGSIFKYPRNCGTWLSTLAADGAATRKSDDSNFACSINRSANQVSTIMAPVVRAVHAYVDGLDLKRTGKKKTQGFVGEVSRDKYVAEYRQSDDSVTIVSWSSVNGDLSASIVRPGVGLPTPTPTVGGRQDDISHHAAYFLAALPFLQTALPADVGEGMKCIIEAATNCPDMWEDPEMYGNAVLRSLFVISDAFYHALEQGALLMLVPAQGNIPVVSQSTLDLGLNSGSRAITGFPSIWEGNAEPAASASPKNTKKTSIGALKKEYAHVFADRQWTAEEEDLIPVFDDSQKVPAEVMRMLKQFTASQNMPRPMVNFGWRSETSYGKSTGVEMMAAILHVPLVRMTCFPSMETADFLTAIMPDTRPSCAAEDMPTFLDIAADPVTAYQRLTGEEREDVSCDECLQAYGEAAARSKSDVPRFVHVHSNYIKALEHGYLCEIQEPSRIKNPGVLVGLNEFNRPGSVVPLLDGSHIRRHKSAIVVMTDNVGYVSCRPIDNSVLRRLAVIIDSHDLSKAELLDRVIANTGFDNRTLLNLMHQTFVEIKNFCMQNDISEGSISPSELEMWASCVKIDDYKNVRQNCLDCVVSKATEDREAQEQIISVMDRMLGAL